MLGDGLCEIRVDKLGTRLKAVATLSPNDNSFQETGSEMALLTKNKHLQVFEGRVPSENQRNGRDPKVASEPISTDRAPKTAFDTVINIKGQEPVWQFDVIERMPCSTPFSEQDQVVTKSLPQGCLACTQPRGEACELAGVRGLKVLTTVLNPENPIRPNRDAQIGTIEFLLHDCCANQQLSGFCR